MFDYSGRTALITGASAGMGEQFARQLAAKGAHLVLVARREEKLRALAAELTTRHGVRAEVLAADLSKPKAAASVREQVRARGLSVDVLVNNAGFATHGPFEALSIERQSEEISLNVTALVELTHAFLPELLRLRGGVINVASTVAFQPVPFMAVYGASKAFVLSFSEALWGEYRAHGLRVLALCPGATETEFFDVVGSPDAALGKKAPAAAVVSEGLRAFERNRSYLIHGASNYVLAMLSRFTPRAMAVRITGSLMKPKTRQPVLPAHPEKAG